MSRSPLKAFTTGSQYNERCREQLAETDMTAIVLNVKPLIELNDDQFEQLCRNHRELSFERTAKGELVICEADLISDLVVWNRLNAIGKSF